MVSIAKLSVMLIMMMAFAVVGLIGAVLLFWRWLCLHRIGAGMEARHGRDVVGLMLVIILIVVVALHARAIDSIVIV